MCWVGLNNLQVAKEDIRVFKIVLFIGGNHMSYFRKGCCWTINEKKTSEFKTYETPNNILTITKGLHSYGGNSQVLRQGMLVKCCLNGKINVSYPNRTNLCKMNCVIPKGSTYYLNSYDEYVSDALIPISFESISK